jgi:outer membrane receptor protein involved in Fe transport
VSYQEYTKSVSESERGGNYYNLNLNYLLRFDEKGHQLEALGYFSKRTGDDWDEQKDFNTDENWNSIDDYPGYIRTTEIEDNNEFRIKADYTKPFGEEGRLEAGYQSRFDFENEKFLFLDFDYSINDWVENDLYTSEADFKRNIHSVYTTYSNVWGTWGYQLGIRGEYTDREIKNVKSTESYVIDRFDYFPSIHLSKQFEGDHQVLASYSRRIDRPRGRQLDPFVNYMDEFNVRVGNPGLEPEYIDSYELGYQKRLDKSFISLETYYRINKNKITRIRKIQDDGTFLHTYQNLNKDYSLGVELMVNADFTSWFNFNGSVNVYDYRLEGNVEGEDVNTSSTNWSGRMNLTFKMKNDFRAQLTGYYRGPTVTAQGRREGYATANAALRKDFFNRKFSATLAVRDVFASARREMTTSGESFYAYDNYRREAPIVTLNLSYLINNYKKQSDRERGMENGDGDMNGGDMDM